MGFGKRTFLHLFLTDIVITDSHTLGIADLDIHIVVRVSIYPSRLQKLLGIYITITQDAKSGIEVPTQEFTVDELENNITIKVNANVDYKLTPNNDWITVADITRALTTDKRQVTIAALGDAADRDGTITVSNEALNYSATITIKQRNTFYFQNKSIDILVGKDKAYLSRIPPNKM